MSHHENCALRLIHQAIESLTFTRERLFDQVRQFQDECNQKIEEIDCFDHLHFLNIFLSESKQMIANSQEQLMNSWKLNQKQNRTCQCLCCSISSQNNNIFSSCCFKGILKSSNISNYFNGVDSTMIFGQMNNCRGDNHINKRIEERQAEQSNSSQKSFLSFYKNLQFDSFIKPRQYSSFEKINFLSPMIKRKGIKNCCDGDYQLKAERCQNCQKYEQNLKLSTINEIQQQNLKQEFDKAKISPKEEEYKPIYIDNCEGSSLINNMKSINLEDIITIEVENKEHNSMDNNNQNTYKIEEEQEVLESDYDKNQIKSNLQIYSHQKNDQQNTLNVFQTNQQQSVNVSSNEEKDKLSQEDSSLNRKSDISVEESEFEDEEDDEDDSLDINYFYSDSDSERNSFQNNNTRGPYKKYSVRLKKRLVNLLQKGESIKELSLKYSIPIKNLQRWKIYGAERREGGGRKIMDLNMEVILLEYCIDFSLRGRCRCPRKLIMEKAREFTKDSSKFKGSKGWLDKYSIRTGLSKIMYEFKSLKIDSEKEIYKLVKQKSLSHINKKMKGINPLLIFTSQQYLLFLEKEFEQVHDFWGISLSTYKSVSKQFYKLQNQYQDEKQIANMTEIATNSLQKGEIKDLKALAQLFGMQMEYFFRCINSIPNFQFSERENLSFEKIKESSNINLKKEKGANSGHKVIEEKVLTEKNLKDKESNYFRSSKEVKSLNIESTKRKLRENLSSKEIQILKQSEMKENIRIHSSKLTSIQFQSSKSNCKQNDFHQEAEDSKSQDVLL